MLQLLTIFFNILAPVLLLVVLGYMFGPRLQLEARTLSRFAYFILTPAFIIDVLSTADIQASLALQMVGYSIVVQLLCAAIGFIVAQLLRRSTQVTAAYVIIASFPNVGNFGLPIIDFALESEQARVYATIYFLVMLTVSFLVGIIAANWGRSGSLRSVVAVIKTPAIIALPPALLFNWMQISLPPLAARPVELLAGALIPTMLVALGVQLAQTGIPRPNVDIISSSAVRLIGGPVLALLLAIPFGLEGIARGTGVLQASMPTAVLASIIALENELAPQFVIAAVLFSTLASVLTLTVVVAII
ncbi:MAG: transporter [Chloroflexi bacterium AL-W]|nr:transporter [Chloroflexi bacterium AL-N1]NOK70351.1 transporter [Chloroflexi bacterium AL-N10]NOK78029.1 transporter [Chloroflexi bacterium AL-N5]NOK85128.1 transporter [Chloroflexi bacterium AL-W]NOK92117.1 transporter [Chloroflexi bacterium AL-N15]